MLCNPKATSLTIVCKLETFSRLILGPYHNIKSTFETDKHKALPFKVDCFAGSVKPVDLLTLYKYTFITRMQYVGYQSSEDVSELVVRTAVLWV
jgi:hypothetical protein